MEKSSQEIAEYLKTKKGFKSVIVAEENDIGVVGGFKDLVGLSAKILQKIHTVNDQTAQSNIDSRDPSFSLPINNTLQPQTEILNNQLSANSTIVLSLQNGQLNYGIAGQIEKVEPLFVDIIKVIEKIIHRKKD